MRKVNAEGSEGMYVPFAFDQTHNVNAVLSHKFNHGWSAGAVFHINSGRPESGGSTSYTKRAAHDELGQPVWEPVARHEVRRLPAYYRLDLRVAREWRWGPMSMEGRFDMLNATLNREVVAYSYLSDSDGTQTVLRRVPQTIPIAIPTLGLKASY
jgi:hypothetical protein